MAATLRREIGPAVSEPFAKTQAYMAAVILEKLSAQLGLAAAHEAADRAAQRALIADLGDELRPDDPAALRALAGESRDAIDLGAVVRVLYAERAALGVERFERLLARVRRTLRARLDRQLEYAS